MAPTFPLLPPPHYLTHFQPLDLQRGPKVRLSRDLLLRQSTSPLLSFTNPYQILYLIKRLIRIAIAYNKLCLC
jgi:hypothetical protein